MARWEQGSKVEGAVDKEATVASSNGVETFSPGKRSYGMISYMVVLHTSALYGAYLLFWCKWQTLLYELVLHVVSVLGVTAGAHRLWTHRSYSATLPLRCLLAFYFHLSLQGPIITWARDHRSHHKYSDTNADPHNSTRGLFHSHIAWSFRKKNGEVLEKGRAIDISDLLADPVTKYQKKYYFPLLFLVVYLLLFIPTLWGETLRNSYFINALRVACSLNTVFLINSVAHRWGMRPYDKDILPGEVSTVSALALGEGYHNFHHTFPWDYRAAELGKLLNMTTSFIDAMARIGWAYNMKSVSKELVAIRARRNGDGTHESEKPWGWNDKDLREEDRSFATISKPKQTK